MNAGSHALSQAEKIEWLRLIRSENVGPITFRRLLGHFGSAGEALKALPDIARRGGRGRPITVCSKAAAERELAALERLGARLIAMGEHQYPPALAAVEDAPPLICVLGNAHLLERPIIAVVGARNASINGCRFAGRLASELVESGVVVVSGLARGIDTAAHKGALAGGTVAVNAGGVDVVYPPENQGLYREIVAQGAVISEMPPGEEPQARHFPRRNRLVSGMALGVVVVEAAARSGSLITARLAAEQGREVFAVPGSPTDPRSAGPNRLIRDGATLIEGAADVLREVERLVRRPLAEPKGAEFLAGGADRAADHDEEALARARAIVIEGLGPAPVAVDEIIRRCQLSPSMVTLIVLELEMAGRIERHPGNQVALLS